MKREKYTLLQAKQDQKTQRQQRPQQPLQNVDIKLRNLKALLILNQTMKKVTSHHQHQQQQSHHKLPIISISILASFTKILFQTL